MAVLPSEVQQSLPGLNTKVAEHDGVQRPQDALRVIVQIQEVKVL